MVGLRASMGTSNSPLVLPNYLSGVGIGIFGQLCEVTVMEERPQCNLLRVRVRSTEYPWISEMCYVMVLILRIACLSSSLSPACSKIQLMTSDLASQYSSTFFHSRRDSSSLTCPYRSLTISLLRQRSRRAR